MKWTGWTQIVLAIWAGISKHHIFVRLYNPSALANVYTSIPAMV
jgi:hypothetical protein